MDTVSGACVCSCPYQDTDLWYVPIAACHITARTCSCKRKREDKALALLYYATGAWNVLVWKVTTHLIYLDVVGTIAKVKGDLEWLNWEC